MVFAAPFKIQQRKVRTLLPALYTSDKHCDWSPTGNDPHSVHVEALQSVTVAARMKHLKSMLYLYFFGRGGLVKPGEERHDDD